MSKAGKACLIGDRVSVAGFIKMILPVTFFELFQNDIRTGKKISVLKDCDKYQRYEAQNGDVKYISPYFPYGVELYCCDEKYTWEKDDCEYVIFLFSWPFSTKTQLDVFENIIDYLKEDYEKCRPVRFKAVLFHDKNMHIGDSDLQSIDEALKNAESKIKAKISEEGLTDVVEIVSVNNYAEFENLFSGGDKTFCFVNKVFNKQKINVHENILSFKDDYNLMIFKNVSDDFGSNDSFNEVFDSSLARKTNNLLKTYWNILKDSKKWKNFCDNIKELYKDTVKPFSILDLEKDSERVIRLINNEIEKNLDAQKMSNTGINNMNVSICKITFQNIIREYINIKIMDILKTEIIKRESLFYNNH